VTGEENRSDLRGVVVDVTPIVAEHLADNRGPDPADPTRRQRPDYGVVACLAGDVLDVVLTFRGGSAYCCYEPGCHLPLLDGKRWDGLRRRLATAGVTTPPRMVLRLTGVVEEGALFFDFSRPDPSHRGWYAFAPVAARCLTQSAVEALPGG
jgi:hypothetical protein